MTPEPTIADLIASARQAVRGQLDYTADFVRGSDYDAFSGACAMLWVRECRRDTDLFAAIRFHDATGDDLTNLVLRRYGVQRVLDTRGIGTCTLTRPTPGIADKVYQGTRVSLGGRLYRCTSDVTVPNTAPSVTFPIEAVDYGVGVAANTFANLTLEDPITDSSWRVTNLQCGDGTVFEPAENLQARVRAERAAARVGQRKGMIAACQAAGAAYVEIIESSYPGADADNGLNFVYVGNASYFADNTLVTKCTLALRAVRVLGDHLQVAPMARAEIDISVDIYLTDTPVKFDLARLQNIHEGAIRAYFGGTSGVWTYTVGGLTGVIYRSGPEVSDVVFVTPGGDGVIWDSMALRLPATLNRYTAGKVDIRYHAV